MNRATRTSLIAISIVLTACGNKGDLYTVSSEISTGATQLIEEKLESDKPKKKQKPAQQTEITTE